MRLAPLSVFPQGILYRGLFFARYAPLFPGERARRMAGADVDVVTADRGLRERVAAAGASVIGPAWLQSRI